MINQDNHQSDAFLLGKSVPKEELGEGITRQILGFNQNIMMVKIWFEEGAVGYIHHHEHSQVTYIESGEFEVTIGGKTKTLISGDSYYMEPNIKHGAVCKKQGVLLDVFSPIRQDFLDQASAGS